MACIDRQGTLFTQGSGDAGQLGHGDDKKRPVFMPVLALKDKRVIDVSCGDKFTVAITQQRVGIFTNIRKIKKVHDFKKKYPEFI
jgi:alpha-tubulin suppressor-like RCC1 family protein